MLNHFVFKKNISNIYNETDKPISSITRELDLKSKEKEYISLARQYWLIFDKKKTLKFYLIIILATVWAILWINYRVTGLTTQNTSSWNPWRKVSFLKPLRKNIELNAVKKSSSTFLARYKPSTYLATSLPSQAQC